MVSNRIYLQRFRLFAVNAIVIENETVMKNYKNVWDRNMVADDDARSARFAFIYTYYTFVERESHVLITLV